MSVKLVVADFDGTFTEIDEEAGAAVDGWKEDVGRELGLTSPELERRWSAAQVIIESDPSRYGWLMGDKIVAPAYADPLIMARTVSELLFDEARVYVDRAEREDVLQNRLFKGNYGKMVTVFRDGADRFLRTLRKNADVVIVTNSGTDGVARKVQQLSSDHSPVPVRGDAKKYVLDPTWDEVPESVERAGYGRPLFLRRRRYADVLSDLMRERRLAPAEIAVVGDIYELDLLLPQYQGMRVILTPRSRTPVFEIEAVRGAPSSYVAKNLGEVLRYLD